MSLYKKTVKSSIDFIMALLGLIMLSPLIILIIILLFIVNNGAPFFLQSRGGYNQKVFNVIKFKTMNDKRDDNGEFLPDEKRLTKVGNFIRKTSLDELPQLINVLKGDMSLIGPRPFISEYLTIYNDFQKRRHEVKPGITGWAQVNGRNNLTWAEKFKLDVWYVDNISLILDIKILFLTLSKIINSKDVNKEGEVTTVKFNGKN